MKVKLKKDIYDWRAGVPYPAEPVFVNEEQMVKVKLPGQVVCITVKWDDIESAE